MRNIYISPLSGRYSSKKMQGVFSDQNRYEVWRKLWVALAKAQMELGLPISQEQIDELESNISNIDFDRVREIELSTRHDVMAHIRAFGEVAPKAAGIIHLGATSCFVTDNADMILAKEALSIIKGKLLVILNNLSSFALKYKNLPTLSYTHLQPAQPTTVGKRASLWLFDFYLDFCDLEYLTKGLKLLGNKGATGTQASFLNLFDGKVQNVVKLENRIADLFGFDRVFDVSGQTYTRKEDMRIQNVLSGLAQSSYKLAQDMRILQSFGELEEPFGKGQVGSTAMAYKRNPILSERTCSLARYVLVNSQNADMTASVQWMERSLDDSANRRISLTEAFLAIDGVLDLVGEITSGITVYDKVIENRLSEHLPFMATENILMESVKRGANRQELHEVIRQYSIEVEIARRNGERLSLIDKISDDSRFLLTVDEVVTLLDPKDYIGLASYQTETFVKSKIQPILVENKNNFDKNTVSVGI